MYLLPLSGSLSFRTKNIRTENQQRKRAPKEDSNSSAIMLFTLKHAVLCLSMVLAAASFASAVETSTTCVACPGGWYGFNDACYKFFPERLTWKDAEAKCVGQEAHLVSIHSQEEAEKVECLRQGKWVGICRPRCHQACGQRVFFFCSIIFIFSTAS